MLIKLFIEFGSKLFVFLQCFAQPLLINWFQQVIDTVRFKGTDRIFVVSRSKYDHALRIRLFDKRKGNAIGQLDIQKEDIGMGIILIPLYGTFHITRQDQDLPFRAQLRQHFVQQTCRRDFIFYDSSFYLIHLIMGF